MISKKVFFCRDMKLIVNGEPVDKDVSLLGQLLQTMELPERGVAVAVNNTMIARDKWDSCTLSEGDNVLIIKAACGG